MLPRNILPRVKNVEIEEFSSTESIESLYGALRDKRQTALLKTGKTISEHRWSVIGKNPFLIFESRGEDITVHGLDLYRAGGDSFAYLQEIIDNYSTVKLPAASPFSVGAIGALSYDLKHVVEDIPSSCRDDISCCDMHFSFFREYIVVDEREQKFYRVKLDTAGNGPPRGLARRETSLDETPDVDAKQGRGEKIHLGELESNFSEEEYKEAVGRVIRYIGKGTIYQANISQQFRVGFGGDSFRLFEMLNRVNPAPMSAYLDCGDFRLISSSPERFLLRRGQYVESKPIKGTRPRGKDTIEDLRLRQELIESQKDSAELAMIVDLVRNDLGRTAQPGTVRVAAPKIIEEYANVFHSLAIVTSRLRKEVSSLELIRSCFPGGSITGCPKVQAMKVIEEIEKNKRSFYCGSIGCIGLDGNFDMNIAIRTFIEKNGNLYFNLGGGIVYDSDPQEEYDETLHKGETMFQVLKEIYD